MIDAHKTCAQMPFMVLNKDRIASLQKTYLKAIEHGQKHFGMDYFVKIKPSFHPRAFEGEKQKTPLP